MTLVIDAGAVVELLLRGRSSAAIGQRLVSAGGVVHAPHLLDVEVLSALRRSVAAHSVPEAEAEAAVEDLADLPLRRHGHTVLAPRTWRLRHNFSAYDATYVALAEALAEPPLPLLTTDARLARAVQEHTDVEPVV